MQEIAITANPQPRLITYIEGPPGSGKSRQLMREACRLMAQDGLAPQQVLVLGMTHTNVKRLRQYYRLESKLAKILPEAQPEFLTLEQWLLQGLNTNLEPAQRTYRLLSETEILLILGKLLKEILPKTHPLASLREVLSFRKMLLQRLLNQSLTDAPNEETLPSHYALDAIFSQCETAFTHQCEQARLLTHTQLPYQYQRHLQEHSGTVSRPSIILIDEGQELAAIHYEIFELLGCPLILAGNPKLSIRSYRGAQPELWTARPDTVKTFVSQPVVFRGNQSILTLANHLLPQPIYERHPQEQEDASSGVQVQLQQYDSPEQEATVLARQLQAFIEQTQHTDQPAQWSDCVILLRSSKYRNAIISALAAQNIPFQASQLSDGLLQIQQSWFYLLQLFQSWEEAGLNASNWSPNQAEEEGMPQLDPVWRNENNHRISRWLAHCLGETDMANLSRLTQNTDSKAPWLFQLESLSSPLISALDATRTLYVHWLSTQNLPALLEESVNLLPEYATLSEAEKTILAQWLERTEAYQSQYEQLFQVKPTLAEWLTLYMELWTVPHLNLSGTADLRGVKLKSIHQVQGEEARWVAIPFLQQGEFPYNASQSLLSKTGKQQAQAFLSEEARLLAVGMSRATQALTLSCHQQVKEKISLPSDFFVTLKAQYQPNTVSDYAKTGELAAENPPDVDNPEVTEQSGWLSLPVQEEIPFFPADYVLSLSPSAITTYMKCPRQFYYRHLLNVYTPPSEAASLGTLIHSLFEQFNTQAQQENNPKAYTCEVLLALADDLFAYDSDPERFAGSGFSEKEKNQLSHLSPVGREALKTRLQQAIMDLDAKGYFDTYKNPKSILPEEKVKDVALLGLNNCRIRGQLDALIQLENGQWDIVDYKTYGTSKYKAQWQTCQNKLQAALEPLPQEPWLSPIERFASKLDAQYPADYQLPLYYWACEQDPRFQGHLRGASLQLVRPAMADQPQQGSLRLYLAAEDLDQHRDAVLSDIQNWIIAPILNAKHFEAIATPGTCEYCAYASICDGASAFEMGSVTGEASE